jgi:hypothetical protein
LWLLLRLFFASLVHHGQFNIPKEGISAGSVFGYGAGSPYLEQWEDAEGLFDLSVAGDQFFLYCLDADDRPNFITGFSYNGAWMEAEDIQALDEVPLDQSALPSDLFRFGGVFLPHADNHLYIGNLTGSKTELLSGFMNPFNYKASDTSRFKIDSGALSLFSAFVTTVAIVPLIAALLI